MTDTIPRLLALGCLVVAAGCASTPRPTAPPALDALLGSERVSLSFTALADLSTLSADDDFRAALVGRDPHHSHHVVSIRNAEAPHRHDHHDLLVVILKGYGEMLIGQQTRAVGEGSIIYIPRHTRHAFTNRSGEPATAYAIYTPPFDGVDRVADD